MKSINTNSRFVSAISLAILLLAWVSESAETPSSKTLPKIRVHPSLPRFQSEDDGLFVPFGVNYYRPGTGWAPQLWKKFDAEATRKDLSRMKALGVNCVRVFLTYGSFYDESGKLKEEGLSKLDRFLEMAEQTGIYVHPTGPDHWEGMPKWGSTAVDDGQNLVALEGFWRLLAARYRARNVIFAYDLKNEPEVSWDGPGMGEKWNAWVKTRYTTEPAAAAAWGKTNELKFGQLRIPESKDALKNRELLDYQLFREGLADEWTRRQVEAIKAADPAALVTVGLIQWSVPAVLPGLRHYAAFRPERQAKFLDFLEVHFYPLANGAYEYRTLEEQRANLAYLESVVREVARPGKPVVLAEFGWYGGGKPKFDNGKHPEATQEQHADYCRRVVEASAPFVTGWLNWGFYDQPEARDCSELTGLLTAQGETKAWGATFAELSARFTKQHPVGDKLRSRPQLDWDALLTSMSAAAEFRRAYLEAFSSETKH